ncbi:hypothetical protein B566_EDAN011416 [Ephemera danica]|nr:hypothetical protein B566_EDAN011416 [Ephemera danica]
MALYDNQHWLLSHVRHSFISSDDTGFSEMVMLGEDLRLPTMESFPGLDDDEEEEDGDMMSQSFDIQSDLDFGAHRQRSNTAQRLEKMEREWKKAAKIKHIKWENPQQVIPNGERDNLFERKVLKPKEKSTKVSILSSQLKNCPYMPQNPFLEFSKFDGTAQVGVSVRRYAIFITILPPGERDYPLHITVVGTANVRELVGLVLWRCSVERGMQRLPDDLNQFALYIAEDDGEVDWDFPCLDPQESVAKFGFSYLALVHRAAGQVASHFGVPTMSMAISDMSGPTLAERDEIEIGGAVDQALKLHAQQEAEQRMKGHMTAMEAPLYQSYQAYILNKVRARSAVHLGISGEKVEIDPVVHHKQSSRFWARRKAVQYDMTSVAACDMAYNKHSSKAGFRLVIQTSEESGSNFKNLDFEAETSVAQEIVQKVNHILELRVGPARRDYLAAKEQKSQRRRSFSLVLR